MANITGWGRSTWGADAWGEASPVILTGLDATSSLGTASNQTNNNLSVSLGSSTGELGSVDARIIFSITITGESATGQVGSVDFDAEANVTLPTLVSSVGTPSVDTIGNGWGRSTWGSGPFGLPVSQTRTVTVAGFGMTSALGTTIAFTTVDINVTGFPITSALGSPSANEWTANNGAAISTAQSKFGGASLLLDGVNDNVISNNTYDFQSTAFTIEFWARPANATQDEVLLDTRDSTSNPSIYFRQAGTTLLVGRGTVTLLTVNNVFSANTWVSLAVTRGDPFTNTYTVFVDGNNEGDILLGASPTASDIHIGSDFNNTNNWSGYIDEIRLSDIDRYGGTSYTPATSEFSLDGNTLSLLHLDGTNGSTSIIDEAVSNPLVVTGTANISVTGLEGTSATGTAGVVADAVNGVSAVASTLNVGDETVTCGAVILPTGVSTTGTLGSVTTQTENIFAVSDVLGTINIGIVVVQANADINVIGLEATGETERVNVWGITPPTQQNPNWTEIAA